LVTEEISVLCNTILWPKTFFFRLFETWHET